MRAEDSSSASAESSVFLAGAEPVNPGVLKISLDAGCGGGASAVPSVPDGFAFRFAQAFLRRDYLFSLPESLRAFMERLFSGDAFFSDTSRILPHPLSQAEFDALLFAARIFEAESRAMRYLSAAEHSRFLLAAKLRKKGFAEREIQPALDFLCGRGFLDDRRFASAWLRARLSSCINGRMKLAAELAARGVSREDADAALSEFFAERSESELCEKAAEKLFRRGRRGAKLEASLLYKGFPPALVRAVLRKFGDTPPSEIIMD